MSETAHLPSVYCVQSPVLRSVAYLINSNNLESLLIKNNTKTKV